MRAPDKNQLAAPEGPMVERVILHCDCNAYFASVECIERPELKTVPMAVCGDPERRHGIILAKNELAKAKGVVTAEPIWQAQRKCPGLVLVSPHHDKYSEYCKKINALYAEYTDQVEPFSIDESFLDVTGSRRLFGDGPKIADTLRSRIRESFGLTISVGVSFNKTFAKLGSDYKKPDATTVISREIFKDILWPLPASDMMFVGKAAAALLSQYGIRTIGDMAAAGEARLGQILGKSGQELWRCACGLDESPVKRLGEREPVKSISNNITFHRDLKGNEDIQAGLLLICDQLGTRLRQQKLFGAVVQILIKDPNLKTISRQRKLSAPTNTTRELLRAATALVEENWNPQSPIRMLSIGVSGLSSNWGGQIDFFTDERQMARERALDAAVDGIRARFGKGAVQYGRVLGSDIGTTDNKDNTHGG